MTPLPAALEGAARPAFPALVTAWRLDAARYAPQWDSGWGAQRHGGRWNAKGQAAVYCSLDPATCLVEAAVHRGFDVLDSQPHVLSCLLLDATAAFVVQPDDLPNPAWLQGGSPSAGQQRWGSAMLADHGALVLPSTVSRPSWNLVFSPEHAAGRWQLLAQQRLVVDARLNPAT